MSSSSSSIHSGYTTFSPLVGRGERKNLTFSKIIKVVLAALGTIASYIFLPPAPATVVSSVIILATILKVYKETPGITFTKFVNIIPTRWPLFHFPRRRSSTIRTPLPVRRDTRIRVTDDEWRRMGCPTYEFWEQAGRPSFTTWQNPPKRPVVRESTSGSPPRVPVGKGSVTPTTSSPSAVRSSYNPSNIGVKVLPSYSPSSSSSSSSFSSSALQNNNSRRPVVRESTADLASKGRVPVGKGSVTPTASSTSTVRNRDNSSTGTGFLSSSSSSTSSSSSGFRLSPLRSSAANGTNSKVGLRVPVGGKKK